MLNAKNFSQNIWKYIFFGKYSFLSSKINSSIMILYKVYIK